jgi:hypothetical protein
VRTSWCSVWLAAAAGCVSAGGGQVVTAPATPALHAAATAGPSEPTSNGATSADAPSACGKPWKLEVLGGEGKVIVVCAHDVRRAALDESPALGRSLYPALDPAQSRVCACAGRLHPPPFVELLVTAHPEEGRVTVEAKGEEDTDPELGPAFIACVGTLTATFEPVRSGACPGGGAASFVYPVSIDLGHDSAE